MVRCQAKSSVTDTLEAPLAARVRATGAFMHAMCLNGSGAIVRLHRSHLRVPPAFRLGVTLNPAGRHARHNRMIWVQRQALNRAHHGANIRQACATYEATRPTGSLLAVRNVSEHAAQRISMNSRSAHKHELAELPLVGTSGKSERARVGLRLPRIKAPDPALPCGPRGVRRSRERGLAASQALTEGEADHSPRSECVQRPGGVRCGLMSLTSSGRVAPPLQPGGPHTRTPKRNTLSNSTNWWAQQVSNLRPLACKARSLSSQTSPGVAWRGADLPR